MIDFEKLNRKAAKLHLIAGNDQIGVRPQAVFLQLIGNQPKRQSCPIQRRTDLPQKIRNRTDMIFMAVRKDNAAQFVAIHHDIAHVRNHIIDTEHVLLWKHHAAIEDKHVIPIFKYGHVFSEFIDSAKRNNTQFIFLHASFQSPSFSRQPTHTTRCRQNKTECRQAVRFPMQRYKTRNTMRSFMYKRTALFRLTRNYSYYTINDRRIEYLFPIFLYFRSFLCIQPNKQAARVIFYTFRPFFVYKFCITSASVESARCAMRSPRSFFPRIFCAGGGMMPKLTFIG